MIHVICNPTSGKRKAVKNLRIVERLFTQANVEYEVHKTDAIRAAEHIARALTERGENDLVVLGGDGTMHEVLNGIVDPALCRLGLIPSGTGNDFAARLGIPAKAKKAAEIILRGQVKDTDYLEIGDRRCMNVAGIGMDVDVLERCNRGKFKGKLKYFISLLKSIFAFKGYPITVEYEGKTEKHDALIAAACNGSQIGGGIRICPNAVVDDNKISVVVVDSIGGKWKLIKALISLMRGKILHYPATHHFLCERVRFTPDTPCAAQLDGELYTDLQLDVQVRTGLKMYR